MTDLFASGAGRYLAQVGALARGDSDKIGEYFQRLTDVTSIRDREMHVEEVTGADKTIDVVVDIFNRVNSGGTKLSKGDLALAKICASWPEARQEMNASLKYWSDRGYHFSLDWLLRVVNGIVTGKAVFTALADRPIVEIQQGLKLAFKYVNLWLNLIAGHLGLDHDRVLFPFPLVALARYTHLHGGKTPEAAEQAKLLFWYIHTGMWGRYAGSTETYVTQDLDAVERGGVDELIRIIEVSRGDLRVRPENFLGNSMGSRFYPTLYMLTRVMKARDFDTGVVISNALLGSLSGLQVHHIFPKAKLYAAGFERGQVNAIANFCLITQDSNLKVSDADPQVYMPEIESRVPGALASQWVPMDASLWSLDRYEDFLAARRALLAAATNEFLDHLLAGHLDPSAILQENLPERPAEIDETLEGNGRKQDIDELVSWLVEEGYAEPERDVEIAHPDTGRVLAIAEAVWPNGLQEGLGQKIILEMDEDESDEDTLASLGYRMFTSTQSVREFVLRLAANN